VSYPLVNPAKLHLIAES